MKMSWRISLIACVLLCGMQTVMADEAPVVRKVPDALTPVTLNEKELGGPINRRILDLINKNYMVIDVDRDWLDKFRNREERKDRSHWYFGIGKVIDAGSLFAQYTGDERVTARTSYLVDELRKTRDADGYLGFWQVEPEGRQNHINWILHEQEYILLSLVHNFLCTGNQQALQDARIMADYMMKTFPTPQNPCFPPQDICTAGLPEGFLALYGVTGEKKYLDFAADTPHGSQWEIHLGTLRNWKQDFEKRPCHVYVMLARTYAQTEFYRFDGAESLLDMSRLMKQELLEKGRGGMLVTGSCSEGEHFTYNQNGAGAIGESCVTAYMLRWIDSLLRLEGDLHYGDVVERTMYNALFAALSPDGRRIRYFTPFAGERVYDSRDTFCCCGNFRRAVGELPRKVYYQTAEGGIVLNLYTPSQKTFDVQGQRVTLRQNTDYPNSGNVQIKFDLAAPLAFACRFRTPRWCQKMTIQINDEQPIEVVPADQTRGYYELKRTWAAGDSVRITMPMEWRLVRGRAMQKGRVALLRGPVVYCLGKDQNAAILAASPTFNELVIAPSSLGDPIPDTSIRPDGLKVIARAWTNTACTGEQVDVVFTEFPDPSGITTYVLVPDVTNTAGVRIMDDELLSEPRTRVDAEVVAAYYGPKVEPVQDAFKIAGTVVASLADDYIPPEGNTTLVAEFQDGSGSGRWSYWKGLSVYPSAGERGQFRRRPLDAWQARRRQMAHALRYAHLSTGRRRSSYAGGQLEGQSDRRRPQDDGHAAGAARQYGECRRQEFTVRLQPTEVGEHIDFVVHSKGTHVCDSTALRLNIYAADQGNDQIDVTEKVQAVFQGRLRTELGKYATLFGDSAAGGQRTLKLKLYYPADATTTYLQISEDAPIELDLDE